MFVVVPTLPTFIGCAAQASAGAVKLPLTQAVEGKAVGQFWASAKIEIQNGSIKLKSLFIKNSNSLGEV